MLCQERKYAMIQTWSENGMDNLYVFQEPTTQFLLEWSSLYLTILQNYLLESGVYIFTIYVS